MHKYKTIDGKYEKDLTGIYGEVENYYVIKMDEWKNKDYSLKLQYVTETAVEFFDFFLPHKFVAFKKGLNEQALGFENHVL